MLGVLVGYATFALIGVGAGANGVLLLARMLDYGVDRTTFGYTFFTGSAGFLAASAMVGPLIQRWGSRTTVLVGVALTVLTGLFLATRPPFLAFALLAIPGGFAGGLAEAVLNAHFTRLPNAATQLNRLHAFFGLGALFGPPLAAFMLTFTTWPMVSLVLAVVALPLLVGAWFGLPPRAAEAAWSGPRTGAGVEDGARAEDGTRAEDGLGAIAGEGVGAGSDHEPGVPSEADATILPRLEPAKSPGLLTAALRTPAVFLAAVLLAVYVGLELGVGNWGYAFLLEVRSVPELAAGYTLSGFWLGLTVGRFVLQPLAAKLGLSFSAVMYLSLAGDVVAVLLIWAVPHAAAAVVGFLLLGFFLGPVFPMAIAAVPEMAPSHLVPAAIGVLNIGAVIGGSALPWLAGTLAQSWGSWTLLPFSFVLALLQLAVWWRMAARMQSGLRPSTT